MITNIRRNLKSKNFLVFLVNEEKLGGRYESVFFNVIESYNSLSANDVSNIGEVKEDNENNLIIDKRKKINLSGWLISETLSLKNYYDSLINKNLYDSPLTALSRKERLDKWKSEKTKLTLFGYEEKNENLIITSLGERKVRGVDGINNLLVNVSFNEVERKTNAKGKKSKVNLLALDNFIKQSNLIG